MWGSGYSKKTITGGLLAKGKEANLSNLSLWVSTSSVNMVNMEGKVAISGQCSPNANCCAIVPSLVV